MNKMLCASQNTEPKTLPADVCIFGCLGRLSPAAVYSADCCNLTSEWSGGSMFHSLSHIYAKTPFSCIKTVANNALNCWCIVFFFFDRLWPNTAPTLNTTFSSINLQAKWWIHCLLISSVPLLSHATSIYDWPKWVCGVFWCFPGQLLNLGDLSVQHHLCQYNLLTVVSDRVMFK